MYVYTDKSILLRDMILADNKVSLFLNVFGPNPLSHKSRDNKVQVENSLLIGRSSNLRCDEPIPWHAAQYMQWRSSSPRGGMLSVLGITGQKKLVVSCKFVNA